MLTTEDIKARFLADVKDHKINILRDEGLYRHLRFAKPGTGNMRFDIVTWPGYLAFVGDMGDFVFTRTSDMLTFFRGDSINPSYWAEKCVAPTRAGLAHFCQDHFRKCLDEVLNDWLDNCEEEEERRSLEEEARHALETEVIPWAYDDPTHAIRLALDVDILTGNGRHVRPWANLYEYDLTTWDFHYLWCCHALPWAINLYDQATAKPMGADGFSVCPQVP